MTFKAPLYFGFDLSTQQLKVLAVTSDLTVEYEAKFDFDADSRGFAVTKGVVTNENEHEVYAPVAMWLQAIDDVLSQLKHSGLDFSRIKSISGAGQQHGSVYWSETGEIKLKNLDSQDTLQNQLAEAFSHPYSPNWQDASTQEQCNAFDEHLGSEEQLALITGSKAHHRFTGPQILRFQRKYPEQYQKTSRISLVSSFLASIFLGGVAPLDISDVCGMNLWDIKAGTYHEKLMCLAADSPDTTKLKRKLGSVDEDAGKAFGTISTYFVDRYKFDPSCTITPFTGDNPATILALPLRPLDVIVSLGTSTTFLMSTPLYKPDPAVHFFNHPCTSGLYMFMLCYKNGGLAREQVRDRLNALSASDIPSKSWSTFDTTALHTPILGQKDPDAPMKIGLYFPRPEIVPNVRAGEWHYNYLPSTDSLIEPKDDWSSPHDDARAIVESQLLSLRLRSKDLVESPSSDLPPQPRRVYLVGGGSKNIAIAKIAGEVLGSKEGVYTLDVGENACALGAAYKAVWATERRQGETFEQLIGGRWKESTFSKRVAEGYQAKPFELYGKALCGFAKMERQVLEMQGHRSSSAG